MKTLKALKILAIFVAVMILLFIVSYNYTYVELTPDYTNVKFEKKRIGSFSLDLPEFLIHFKPPIAWFTINYPDIKLNLREMSSNYGLNKEGTEQTRCYPDRFKGQNQEEDFELSQLSHRRAVLFLPEKNNPEHKEINYSFFLKNGRCVLIYSFVHPGENAEAKTTVFKNTVKNFFQYYKFREDDDIDEKGFRTEFGSIAQNNQFTIDAHFTLATKSKEHSIKSMLFNLNYFNDESKLDKNYPVFNDRFYGKRLTSYLEARYFANSITDFNWSLSRGDFQFSSLYFGKEFLYMPISINSYPVFINISSQSQIAPGKGGFSKYIEVSMFIFDDYLQTTPNYNTFYGYWVRAKESARAM
ncbi:MAG: hypothetical protein LBQ79_12150 [Deltaproteobacteria bacterium]|jgi:hypothetical protein|nr:hypothetical protein [Deltaproteobacteria bacterium]